MQWWRSRLVKGVLALGMVGLATVPAVAVKLTDGKTYFVNPPRLQEVWATQRAANFWGSTYYFTLSLPSNAGEPLKKVEISLEPAPDYPRFDLRRTVAFTGTNEREATRLPLESVTFEPQKRVIAVVFQPPVDPGTVVTIGLYAVRNPFTGGIYLYGVKAFPIGAEPHGQFLGYGRIHIDDNRFDFFHRRW